MKKLLAISLAVNLLCLCAAWRAQTVITASVIQPPPGEVLHIVGPVMFESPTGVEWLSLGQHSDSAYRSEYPGDGDWDWNQERHGELFTIYQAQAVRFNWDVHCYGLLVDHDACFPELIGPTNNAPLLIDRYWGTVHTIPWSGIYPY